MIQLINKLKKNQKGFTLVELIVVLVILAILAAFTIPAMLGFVNDAKGKATIAEAREALVAAQGVASEVVAKEATTAKGTLEAGLAGTTNQSGTFTSTGTYDQLKDILGTDVKDATWIVECETKTVGTNTYATGEVKKIEFTKNGYKVTIDKSNNTTDIAPLT